jgi:peptidoglycan/LPS O-acetylase OafA/YrhL
VPALDGIRAIAILAVMGLHVVVELAPGGSISVDVFFALFGLLITGLLQTELRVSKWSNLSTF